MWYDCLAVAILAFTTIRGAMKGVVWQIAAIAGLVLCFVFSESISAAAGPYVKLEPPLNNWVVMAGAYLVFSFGAFAIARLLTEWLDKIHFGDFNRHLGAIFGFVKGALIVLVLTFFSVTVSERMHQVLQGSRTGRIAAIVMYHLHPVMPEKLHDTLARYINIHKLDDQELQRRYQEREQGAGHVHDAPAQESDLILPSEFEAVLAKLPPDKQSEFRVLLQQSLDQSAPESRLDLLDSLINTFKKVKSTRDLTSLMEGWRKPADTLFAAATDNTLTSSSAVSPVAPEPPAIIPAQDALPSATAAASPREQLLREICAEFSQHPLAQQRIREDIERQLTGLPDAVAVSVLEDWRSDLIRARPGQATSLAFDPDPSTNAATPLKNRIVRQTAQDSDQPFTSERLQ